MRRWKYGVLSFKGVADLDSKEWFVQLPFIIAVSVGAGLLGALFNLAHKHILKVRAPVHALAGKGRHVHHACRSGPLHSGTGTRQEACC